MTRFWRVIRFLSVSSILLLAIWLGVKEGVDGYRGAATASQRIAAGFQIAYGIAAAAALLALLTHRTWLKPALLLWVLTIATTAAAAPVVWGGAGWASAALASAVTLAASGLVMWGCLAHARGWKRLPGSKGEESFPQVSVE